MVTGLFAGALFALGTVILGMAMELPVYSTDLKVIFLAPYISNFLQFAFSAAWLAIYLGKKKQCRQAFKSMNCKGGRTVMLASLLGGPVGMSAYVVAVHYIGPSFTAAISALFPAVGALLAYMFLNERMMKFQILGLIISVFGVAILGFEPGTGSFVNAPLGFLFAIICCLSWAMETVLFSYGFRQAEITQSQALLVRQTISAVVCGFIILPLLQGWKQTILVFPDKATLYILFGALFFTSSYLCYYRAILNIGATKAMTLNITYAAWSIVFSLLLMHIIPSVKSIICSILIVGGSLVASVTVGKQTPPYNETM